MSHCNKVIGSSPEGEQKAHKCTCFARSALFTGSFDLHALKGNDDNDDDDNDDNDDDDDKDDDDKDHDNENAIFEYGNNLDNLLCKVGYCGPSLIYCRSFSICIFG